MMTAALAVDFGSSSGRVLAGIWDGERITVQEVHRFAHEAQLSDGQLHWDLEYLWREAVAGLRKAVAEIPEATSVTVDTWGVDFVCLDESDQQVGLARAYRDERTNRTHDAFRARLSDGQAWTATGIAPAPINTANQLFALQTEQPALAASVNTVLLLPDYFTWRLSGVKGWSRSIASTSGLTTPGAKEWSHEVFSALGLSESWFGELTDEMSIVGPCTVPGLEQLQVVRGGAHDTACAVHALPQRQDADSFFLSSGSWSLLGTTSEETFVTDTARTVGITNEVRTDGGVRPLFNLTGLWILQECQRQWEAAGEVSDIRELVALATKAPASGVVFDPTDDRFVAPGGMVERVKAALAEHGFEAQTQGQLVRAILDSLAARYAQAVADLRQVTGKDPTLLHVVGGGSRNELLCTLTAARTGIDVLAGPAEASTLGAILASLTVLGEMAPADLAAVVAASVETRLYPSVGT